MPTEAIYTAGQELDDSQKGNSLVFSPTDFLQTEKAWTFYTCKTEKYPWFVLTTQLYLNHLNGRGDPPNAPFPIPEWKYFRRLMQVIPYGLADGSLDSSFPDSESVLLWLMRAVAIEEQAIQNGIPTSDFENYLRTSRVRSEGEAYAQEIFDMYVSGKESEALALIQEGKLATRDVGALAKVGKAKKAMTRSTLPAPVRYMAGDNSSNPLSNFSDENKMKWIKVAAVLAISYIVLHPKTKLFG
jgi:hypothetical protein